MTFSFSLCSGLNNNIPRNTRTAFSDIFAGTIGTKGLFYSLCCVTVKGRPKLFHFFQNSDGKGRIQSRSISDPTLSDIDFKNKMVGTLKNYLRQFLV